MGASRKVPLELGKRERQIYETVLTLGESSVADVLERLVDPPSYSATRATLNLLVKKNWLKVRKGEVKYLYSAAADRDQTRRWAIRRLLSTCFDNSVTAAVAALLDDSARKLTDDELKEMIDLIQQARKGGKS